MYLFMYNNGIVLFKLQKIYKKQNPQVSGTSNGKLMILSKCAIFKSKKSKFINK